MTASILVFFFTYVVFSIGRVPGLRSDRMAAAVIGGVVVVALRVLSFEEAQAAVDGRTIGLLFGMMVLSSALEASGAFGLVGWWILGRARSPRALLVAVCVASAALSALMINDVVCLAFTPLVLHVTQSLNRDPKPYLVGLATSSNIGSVATITGNPQNILIGSLSHIPYAHFAMYLVPVAIIGIAIDVAVLSRVYRAELARPFDAVSQRPRPRVVGRTAWKGALVTAAVLVAFIAGAPPHVAALIGGSAMLLTRSTSPARIYARIDWTLLALFTGLFVVVAAVERHHLPERVLAFAGADHAHGVWGLTAVTALLSNVVSNVPAVMVLKSLMPPAGGAVLPWLTLAMASTLAGNLTLPGSIASIIVVERAKQHTTITFLDFAKVGVPVAILTLAAGAAWLALVTR